MTLDEALRHWERQRDRLQAIDAWIDAGKPDAPPPLAALLGEYQTLRATKAKGALKEAREEAARDAFIRMFSAFEQEFRGVFCAWLTRRCGSNATVAEVATTLPESIRSLLGIAAVLEPKVKALSGFAGNVMDSRNDLVHRGFAAPMPYDLVKLHRDLSALVAALR